MRCARVLTARHPTAYSPRLPRSKPSACFLTFFPHRILCHEKNLSAEQPASQAHSRLSRPNVDPRRPQGPQQSPREGTSTALPLTASPRSGAIASQRGKLPARRASNQVSRIRPRVRRRTAFVGSLFHVAGPTERARTAATGLDDLPPRGEKGGRSKSNETARARGLSATTAAAVGLRRHGPSRCGRSREPYTEG